MWFYNLLEEMALRLFIPFLMAINIQYIYYIRISDQGSRRWFEIFERIEKEIYP